MFYWKQDKELINECFERLDSRVRELSRGLYEAEHRIKKLEATVKGLEAAYGLKKDGTPRAKPGRKVGF